jgi:capsular exopolysaccharide synthesis family protein
MNTNTRIKQGENMDYLASNQEKLLNFFYVLYKRKFFIIAFFIATYLGIVAGTWLATHSYKATTKILIKTNPKQEIFLFPDLAKPGERGGTRVNLAQDLVQIITGEELGREIVSSFGLDKLYYKKKHEPESYRDIVWFYIYKAIDVIKFPYTYSKLLLVHLGFLSPEPEENYFHSALQEFLEDWLDVRAERESRVINVSVWGPEPRLSSNIANRMAELLVDRTLAITREQALAGYDFTVAQLQNVEDRYIKSQEDLRRFSAENNIVSIEDQKRTLVSKLDRLETEVAEIEADLRGTIEKANEIKRRLNKERERITLSSSTLTGNNAIVTELQSRLNNNEIKLSSMIAKKTNNDPDVLKLKADIQDIKEKLRKEVEKIVLGETEQINSVYQNLRQKLIDLESQELYFRGKKELLGRTISETKKTIELMPQKEIELKRLETKADIYTGLYSTVKDKLEKLFILKSNEVNEFGLSVITKSDLPEVADVTWPMWDINAIYVGLPLSIIIALFASFFVDYWTDTFRTKKEAEFNLELPVIGLIPDLKKKGTKRRPNFTTNKGRNKGVQVWPERRAHFRVSIHSSMIYEQATTARKHQAMLKNISEDGFCLVSSESLNPDEIIKPKMLFDIEDVREQLEFGGKVIWSRCIQISEGKESFAIGLQFAELQEDTKLKIIKLIKSKQKKGIEKGKFQEDDVKVSYLGRRDSMANNSFGILADNICWNALEKSDDRIYLITSASLGEGKTTVSLNLAFHTARRGKKVLLIDANLRNPAIGEIFNIKSLPGLTQIMCDGASIRVLPVEGYNIHLIPSGKIDHEPFEVLTATRFEDFLKKVKKFYDFVIIDCPAVNFYVDPLLLCPSVDQVIFVVLADKTEKSEVLIAKAKILNAQGKILGVVLNGTNSFISLAGS